MSIQPEQTILNGKYRIERLIGEGGMARVWLAEELTFGRRPVALKEPRNDLLPEMAQEVRLRYQHEVQVCAALEKARVPHIVRAFTADPYEDTVLLAMEYMPGGDLAALLKQHPEGLPIERAVAITLDLLQALEGVQAHELEIVHRDVKPSNVLFDEQGRAHLADFGLAQLAGVSGRSQLAGGQHPGTPMYMAPEQESSPRTLTPSADLYAVGCVLFEMLTGKRYKRVRPGTPPSALRAEVPTWLDDVVAHALAEDPWDRYQRAEEMARPLREGLRREAEERARAWAAEEAHQRQAEERDRAQAEEEARRWEAEERAQAKAAEQARQREAEQQARAEAAEGKRRRKAAERARKEDARRARRVARARVPSWFWAVVGVVLLVATVGLGLALQDGGGDARTAVPTTVVALSPPTATTPVPATTTANNTPTPSPSHTSNPAPTSTPSSTPTPTPGSPGADQVIAYNPGPGAETSYQDPDALLGAPDLVESPCCQGMVQLGRGGSVLLAFVDNLILDGDGPDFQVYGESVDDDFLLVEVSADGQSWKSFPKVSESPDGLDLADVELPQAVYVRLTDVQPATLTGAEVDAVVALHSGPAPGALSEMPDAVARSALNLYEGESKLMKVVSQVEAGQALQVLGPGRVAGWVKVKSALGTTGWCPMADLGLNVTLVAFTVVAGPVTPTATPSAGRIAFVSDRDVHGSWEIYVMNPDGTDQRRLTNNTASDFDPAWSPDGKRILFTSNRDGTSDIYVMNADGSGQTRLTINARPSEPDWSPDGRQIVFASSRDSVGVIEGQINVEIYVMNADGSGQRRLTNNLIVDSSPDWSPDGKLIVFDTHVGSNPEIHVIGPDGLGETRLSLDRIDLEPAWSPDGRRIAFVYYTTKHPTSGTRGSPRIYVMNADGSGRMSVGDVYGFHPTWSPDGKRIAFDAGVEGICVMNADGSGVTCLEGTGRNMYPDWSPQ